MTSRHQRKLRTGAAPHLEPNETVLAAIVAAARGFTQSLAGSSSLGRRQRGGNTASAQLVGVRLESPMGLVLTDRRLLTLAIGTPIGLGVGGSVKRLLSAVPIADVDAIEVRRLLLGYRLALTVRGVRFDVEANAAADARGLAAALDRSRTAR